MLRIVSEVREVLRLQSEDREEVLHLVLEDWPEVLQDRLHLLEGLKFGIALCFEFRCLPSKCRSNLDLVYMFQVGLHIWGTNGGYYY